jgi:glycosyltransferase involved in cell wall biosynthesis
VLYPEHSAYIGGGQTYLFNILRYLDREKFEPLATVVTEGDISATLSALEVSFEVVDMRWVLSKNPLATCGNFHDFYRIIREHRIDVVHCNSQKSLMVAGPPARLAGARVLWHAHVPSGLGRAFDVLGCFLAHMIVVNSNHVRRRFEGCPGGVRNLRVVPYGIDTERFSVTRDGSDIRREFGIAGSDQVIGYVGRLEEEKGTQVLIEAVPAILGELPAARFLIAGEASDEQAEFEALAEERVRQLGIADRVRFAGFRNDVPDLIAAMDVVVVPSLREAFGLVNVEVMACGRPLVATRVGGIPEVVEDGATGILVPPADSGALADAVIGLMRDPDRRRAMAEAGRRRAAALFDIRAHVSKMQALYEEMVARNG